MNNKVVTFGEIMLRLTPPNYKRIVQADSFDVIYGGGEPMSVLPWPTSESNPIT